MRLHPAVVLFLIVFSLLSVQASAQVEELSTGRTNVSKPPSYDTLRQISLSPPVLRAPVWYAMITNIPGDWVRTGATTFHWESVPTFLGVASATSLMLLVDHQTYRTSHRFYRESGTVHSASDFLIRVGDGRTSLGVATAFAVYGFADADTRALRTASQTVEAMLASGIVVQMLKRVAGRESPQVATHDGGVWRPFPSIMQYNHHQSSYYAFPSGHITTMMATTTVIAGNYPEIDWVRPVGYTLTGLTAMALVNRGWHWYSDFPLAIAMGYTFGRIAVHRDDEEPAHDHAGGIHTLQVLPSIGPTGPGITLALAL